jgi:hypothetical protein
MSDAPRIPEDVLEDGWREIRTHSKDELTLPFFSISSHSRLYEHADSAEEMGAVTGVRFGMPPRAAFTAALEFDPPLPSFGVEPESVFGIARRRARKEFPKSLSEDGLVDVERTDARWLERTDGTRTRAFRYEVGFPLDPEAIFGAAAPTAFDLGCVMWGGIWPTEEAYAMAGGVYPSETLPEAIDRQTPGSDPVRGLAVEVDPVAHRKALARVIRTAGL